MSKFETFKRIGIADIVADHPIAVIGDVHESLAALKALVAKIPLNATIIFVGDLIDKGTQPKETLEYVKSLKKSRKIIVVIGNHERYVARRLMGQMRGTPEIESFVFTAVNYALNDAELTKLIIEVYDSGVSLVNIHRFGRIIGQVTHAPCRVSQINGTDVESETARINYRFINRDTEADMLEELSFVFEEADDHVDAPVHIFGHIPVAGGSPVVYKNKVFLDTGAFMGGGLSAFVFDEMCINRIITVPSEFQSDGTFMDVTKAIKEM